MADESSSIALQLNVQLRGLVNLTKLNRELTALKQNAQNFQRNVTAGNSTLANTAKQAKAAADGLAKLTKAHKDASRVAAQSAGGASRVNLMQQAFSGFSREARQREKAAKDAARARVQAESMYARMFDQLERQQTAAARRENANRVRIHAASMRAQAAELRKQQAVVERTARIREAASRRQQALIQREQTLMTTLTGRLRLFEEQNDAIFRAGFRLQMLGNDMEAVGRKTVMALAGMSKEFGDFEFMVNRAAGATGILQDETDEGVNVYTRFKDRIQDASQELRLFNPAEVAKATYYWASTSGQQVDTLEDMERALRAVNPLMKIAAMTETDYETAIKGVYGILVQYGLGLDDVQEVTEKLHMVTQRTAAEFPDLVNSFKMVGPVAKEFGVTFDDMVVLLGRLADAGIRGTMSGRAFRQFFIQISRPAPKATAALNALWESTEKFGDKSYIDTVFPAGKFIGVNNYVNELAKRLQNATDKERMFTLATITTANELPVLTALVSKQIAELKGLGGGWDTSKENLQDAAEGFQRSWDILRTSWNGTVGALTRGMEIIRMKVGERIAKMFTPIIEQLTERLTEVRRWFEDPANSKVIDFFVQLAAAAGGILAVGGALTVFVGVMISLAAATRVALGAFKPLFGMISKVGGVIALFAVAAVRNFEYLKEVFSEVFETIEDALKNSGSTMEDVSGIFTGFSTILSPILDMIIRVFGNLLLLLSRVTAAVLKNKDAMGLLSIVATALGGIIAANLVISVGKAIVGFNLWAGAATKLRAALLYTATSVKVLSAAANAGGFSGLAKGLMALLPALGPAGWLAAGVAAVAGVFAVAYTNSDNFRNAVDRMVFEWLTGMDELISKTEQVYQALGKFGPEAKKALSLDPVYKQMEADIERMRSLAANVEMDGIIDFGERDLLNKLKVAEKDFQQYSTDIYQTYLDKVSQLQDLFGSDVTVERYMSQLRLEANKLNVALSDTQAASNTWDFFRNLASDAKEADAQAASLLRTIESPSAYDTEKTKAETLAKLADLRGSGKVSEQVAAAIDKVLTTGTTQGVVNWSEDPTGGVDVEPIARESFVDIGNTFVQAASGTINLGKALREAMKSPTQWRQAKDIIKEYLKGPIAQGFTTSEGIFKPGAALVAQGMMDDVQTAFQTQFEQYENLDPRYAKSWANAYANNLAKNLKPLSSKVSPTMRNELAELFSVVYAEAGKPVPQSVLDKIFGKGKVSAEQFNKGVTSQVPGAADAGDDVKDAAADGMKPTPGKTHGQGSKTSKDFLIGFKKWKDDIATASDGIGSSTAAINKNGGKAYTWGSHMAGSFAKGLLSQKIAAMRAANAIAGAVSGPLEHTTPKEGPLKDDDQWGYHLGQNIADGMNRSRSLVASSAMSLAKAASLANTYMDEAIGGGITAETTASRSIKVQVEVTSPDGSVDRLKAAELERGLQTSDLILSLEHMSTVG